MLYYSPGTLDATKMFKSLQESSSRSRYILNLAQFIWVMNKIHRKSEYGHIKKLFPDSNYCAISCVADVQTFCAMYFCKTQRWLSKCPLTIFVVIASVKQQDATEYSFMHPTNICQIISKLLFAIRGTVLVQIDNELSSSQFDEDSIDKYRTDPVRSLLLILLLQTSR
jgi:hypothetical protein